MNKNQIKNTNSFTSGKSFRRSADLFSWDGCVDKYSKSSLFSPDFLSKSLQNVTLFRTSKQAFKDIN